MFSEERYIFDQQHGECQNERGAQARPNHPVPVYKALARMKDTQAFVCLVNLHPSRSKMASARS